MEIIESNRQDRDDGEEFPTPEQFANTWITKLYGLEPGDDLYRKACIQEFCRFLKVKKRNAYKNWVWTGDRKHEYPKDLPAILWLLDQRYKVMEAVGCLPKYTIERDADWN